MGKKIKVELTEFENEVVRRVLSSAIDCFENASFDNIIGEYTDGGNFICSLPSKRHIQALTKAYYKL